MPVLQPAEPWRKSGRLEIDELFKLTDRKGSELVLAMTHEEAVTFHVAQVVRSYRDLPLILYHFQIKERDEPRPRAGVLRTREFIMKDSYSLRPRPGGSRGALRAACRRLRPHHGAHGPALLPRRGGRRDDGRAGRARVHGAVRRGRGRGGARARLRRQRRGRAGAARTCARRLRATPWAISELSIEPAIEVGNIFKLGTRYSEPLGASYLDEQGHEQPIWMGSYGIGPARIVAAAVEQFADEHGISWPRALAPFAVHLVALGKPGTPEREAAEQAVRDAARGRAWRCSTTTATLGPGEKFADAELLGCPLRLTVGRRALESGEIEVQVRRGREPGPGLPLEGERAELVRSGGRAVAEPPVDHPERMAAERPRRGGSGEWRGGRAPGPPREFASPVRPRPLRPAAAGDAQPASRCARGRSPTRSASCAWR